MEIRYRLEFNEDQQLFHLDNGTHKEGSFGWITITPSFSSEDLIIFESWLRRSNRKKYTAKFLIKELTNLLFFRDELHKYGLQINNIKTITP
jgi:hypothetical protein